MDDYLSKPIDRRSLREALSRWCSKERAGSQEGSIAVSPVPVAQGLDSHPGAADEASPDTTASAEAPALDERRLEEMRQLLEESPGGFYAEVLVPYLASAERQIRDLAQATAGGDSRSVQSIAHTLKGSSLNLGFVGLGRHAQSIEVGARKGTLSDPAADTAALQDEFRRVALFAERYRR
jgi:HPt (histidine-containing phosphotransfer) domain-containing protein